MKREEIFALLDGQRKFYRSGRTLSVKFRIESLKSLYSAIKKYEGEINEALKADLGKSAFESFM